MDIHLLNVVKQMVKDLNVETKDVKEAINKLKEELDDEDYEVISDSDDSEDEDELIEEEHSISIDKNGFHKLKEVSLKTNNKISLDINVGEC